MFPSENVSSATRLAEVGIAFTEYRTKIPAHIETEGERDDADPKFGDPKPSRKKRVRPSLVANDFTF